MLSTSFANVKVQEVTYGKITEPGGYRSAFQAAVRS
jgi:hypothetical protein